jgi:hypothetical protein
MSDVDRLAAEKYVLLTTYRKDGTGVPTPVWVARDGESLLVWSAPDAGKVKRVRRDPRVAVAPCTSRGRPTGPEVSGTAELVEGAAAAPVHRAVTSRYGLLGTVIGLVSRLRRRGDHGAGIRIHLG